MDWIITLRGQISTHAPREGSDGWCSKDMLRVVNFNPRSP